MLAGVLPGVLQHRGGGLAQLHRPTVHFLAAEARSGNLAKSLLDNLIPQRLTLFCSIR